jgi:hypothetical protein
MDAIIKPGKDIVRDATSEKVNQRIDRGIHDTVEYYSKQSKKAINARVRQLDKEWDMERTLELNASLVALTGVILSATVSKKWLILPAVVTAFLAQHAIQGWCPPVPLFRKMGVRTQKEIQTERHALLGLLKK